MPSLFCPPPLPPLSSISASKSPRQSLLPNTLSEEDVVDARSFGIQTGNPITPLATFAFSSVYHTNCKRTLQFRGFRRNCRLPNRNSSLPIVGVIESFDFGKKNGGFFIGETIVKGNLGQGRPLVIGRCCGRAEGVDLVEKDRAFATRRLEYLPLIEETKILACGMQNVQSPAFEEQNSWMPTKGVDDVEKGYFDQIHRENGHRIVDFVKDKHRLPGREETAASYFDKSSMALSASSLVDQIRSLLVGKNIQIRNFSENRPFTISDFSDILIALIKADELGLAVDLFSELPSSGLSPDSLCFSVMIQCLCKRNEPDKAKLVLHEMLSSGFQPNTVTFTVLINCFCKKGKLQKAVEVFEIMGNIGCEPTTRTYNCLLNGLCYVGRVEEAFQLLRKMEKSLKKPDIYTYTTVMDGFCKVGRSDEAVELLDEAIKIGLKPTVVTFNSLLNGYCKEGRPLKGVGLLKEMEGIDCKPDIISYNTLLQGLLRWGESSAALSIYKQMMHFGFEVDERVINTLLRGICRQSITEEEQLKEAEELFGRIVEMGYNLSPYTYCLMVQALASGGEISKAFTNLLEMVRIGYSPRMMTFNMVIRVLCREGRTGDALVVLVLMIELGTIPSTFTFTVLVDEFNRKGRLMDACGVYGAALKRGVTVKRILKRNRKLGENSSHLFSVQEPLVVSDS